MKTNALSSADHHLRLSPEFFNVVINQEKQNGAGNFSIFVPFFSQFVFHLLCCCCLPASASAADALAAAASASPPSSSAPSAAASAK